MENNNPNTPNTIPQGAPVQPSVAPQPEPQIQKDAKNFKDTFKDIKENLPAKFNSLPKNTKLLISVATVAFMIIILLFILVALFAPKKSTPQATPSPTPIAVTPAPEVILGASRYATDSGVLKIEEDLNGFQKQLNVSDVKQGDLSLPVMDFNINFGN